MMSQTVHVTDTEKYAGTGVTCYVFMDLAKADLQVRSIGRVERGRYFRCPRLKMYHISIYILSCMCVRVREGDREYMP